MRKPTDRSPAGPGRDRQERVDDLFTSTAPYWRSIYDEEDVDGWIFRRRGAVAAAWIEELVQDPDRWAVELGCGAGLLAAELAEGGITMRASDHTEVMVRQARATAAERGVADRVSVVVADAHQLPWPTGRAPLVTALGLIPWLHAPDQALREMARVLAPGGHLVVTSDNSVRLAFLFDPTRTPVAGPLRRPVGRTLRRLRRLPPAPARERRYTPRRVDRLARRAGLRVVERTTVGFGPFTMFGRPVLSTRRGLAVQRFLQRLADRRVPILRSLGNHYMVVAEKPAGAGDAAPRPQPTAAATPVTPAP